MPFPRAFMNSISLGVPAKGAVLRHTGKRMQSPSTEPHAGGRPNRMGCSLVPQGSNLWHCCWLPHCHAAMGTVPSTVAWVDQSPVSQRVMVTLYEVSPPHLLPPPTWPRVRIASMCQDSPPHGTPSSPVSMCQGRPSQGTLSTPVTIST
jgi:hypothetical protein